jgi:hypothetical protein
MALKLSFSIGSNLVLLMKKIAAGFLSACKVSKFLLLSAQSDLKSNLNTFLFFLMFVTNISKYDVITTFDFKFLFENKKTRERKQELSCFLIFIVFTVSLNKTISMFY